MKPLEAKARANQAEIQRLKEELKGKKKVLSALETAMKTPVFRCSTCRKVFFFLMEINPVFSASSLKGI